MKITKKQLKKITRLAVNKKLNEVHDFDGDIWRQSENIGLLDTLDKIYMELQAMGENSVASQVENIMMMVHDGAPKDVVIEKLLQAIPIDIKDALAPSFKSINRKGLGGAQAAHDALSKRLAEKKMKITKGQLKRIIKEEYNRILQENRFGRLTLWLQPTPNGQDLEIFVNESDTSYNLGEYYHNNMNVGDFLSQFEDDHGYPMPAEATVEDIDGIGIGTLPVIEAFEAAMDMYSGL